MADALSRLAQVLAAAHTLPQPFRKEAITVRTWELFPERFGLEGFPYPDSHAVYVALTKLVQQGRLDRPTASLYTLPQPPETPMRRSSPMPPPPPPPLPPETFTEAERLHLQALETSAVLRKAQRGTPLTAEDARALWGASRYEVGAPLAEKIRTGTALLQKARRAASSTHPLDAPPPNVCVTLANLSDLCLQRFGALFESATQGAWRAPKNSSGRA